MDSFQSFIKEYGGDPDFKALILDTISQYFPEHLSKLKKFFSEGDYISLRKQAHAMKGSAASLGMKEIAEYALIIQTLEVDDAVVYEQQISKIEQELSNAEKILADSGL